MNNFIQVLPVAEPYCIILWQSNNDYVSKTVCYSPGEAIEATNRFYLKGDFYNRYDDFEIEYSREDSLKYA